MVNLLLLIIVINIVILPLWNHLCKMDQPDVKGSYGQAVEVHGYNMTVDIRGEGSETIILLPGWGSPSPVLEFLPLAEELAKQFRVITIEPFGYGLSDPSCEERNIDTIVQELHECTQKLGCQQYYLMAHSISGVYSLYWANVYQQEVQGFIGIDCSVPKQFDKKRFPISIVRLNRLAAFMQQLENVTGITRLKSMWRPNRAINADFSFPYSEEELDIFIALSIDYSNNSTVMAELSYMETNLEIVSAMTFPENVPVLHFISEDSCKILDTWELLHRSIITEINKSEVLHFGKEHYLHLEQRHDMAEKVMDWIQQ